MSILRFEVINSGSVGPKDLSAQHRTAGGISSDTLLWYTLWETENDASVKSQADGYKTKKIVKSNKRK